MKNNKPKPSTPSSENRHQADYAMAFDLVGKMARVATEEEVIARISELFTAICAPGRLAYLQFIDGMPAAVHPQPASLAWQEETTNRLTGISKDCGWTSSESGFMLHICLENETLGILEAEGIAFPEYLQHYLNLGINLTGALALAISNARYYEHLKKTQYELTTANERLQAEIGERRVEHERAERLASFPELNPNAIVETDAAGMVCYSNPAAKKLFPDIETAGRLHPVLTDLDVIVAGLKKEKKNAYVHEIKLADAWHQLICNYVQAEDRIRIHILDITARKRAEQEQEITVEFLQIANASEGTDGLIKRAATFFQEKSGCEAVGIRLKEGDDYPYYEARGFPKEFVQKESSLCACDAAGEIIRDDLGNPVLACMCGNIICGRFDTAKPFFTAGGSFWSNCMTELLATTTDTDRQARTRNRCNGEGYESVALVPLQAGEERLGLVQLSDRRKGMFSPETIALWERLAGYLAVALSKFRAEAAQRKSEERLRLAMDAAHSGTWEWDLRTNKNIWCEELWELYGLEPHSREPSYETWLQTILPDDRPDVEQAVRTATQRGTELNVEWRVMGRDGRERWLMLRGQPLRDAGGRVVRYVGIVLDITGRKEAEVDIRKLNNELHQHVLWLQDANKEIESFSYSVSHDLRAPLRIIDGFVRAIEEEEAEKLSGKSKDYFRRVRAAAERMGQLIDAILSLSRLTRDELIRTPVDLSAAARAVIEDLRRGHPGRQVECVVPDNVIAEGDAAMLHAVITNLLQNAWKFTLKTEKARIEFGAVDNLLRISDFGLRNETVSDYVKRGKMVYYVRDNGAGFDMAYANKLFMAFQRLHTADEFPGLGIGLATVQRIIHLHGGKVWAESDIGKGAVFYFTV